MSYFVAYSIEGRDRPADGDPVGSGRGWADFGSWVESLDAADFPEAAAVGERTRAFRRGQRKEQADRERREQQERELLRRAEDEQRSRNELERQVEALRRQRLEARQQGADAHAPG
jgi:hypothetical protein